MKQGLQDLLGTWLVNEGVITAKQLDQALDILKGGKDTRGFLGKYLVQQGFCTEDEIAKVVAKLAGVPFVSLENYQIDVNAVTTIPAEALKRYRALPIEFKGDKLVIAMQHPNDVVALDDLRILTNFDIVPVVAPDSELAAALEKYSRVTMDFDLEEYEESPAEALTVEVDESTMRPAVQLANIIITRAVNAKASDIHIEPYERYLRIRFRIDGVLHDIMQQSRRLHASLVSRIKVMANMNIAERRVPQDGRVSMKIEGHSIDIRVATLPTAFGERVTMRLLDRFAQAITLEELGVAPQMLDKFKNIINIPYGFILVTGPTGSGKTTTLYASLAAVDRVEKNVITVEDPVEYRMDGVNQIQINPKAGLTFASGLRSILRSDPDIIMVGEIRDRETARIAVESALTGHLVFSTLHTNDAAGAISRLTEMGIEPFLTASSLACVLAQRLTRVLCSNCKKPHELTRGEVLKIAPDFPLDENEKRVTLYRPGGCMRCNNTGFRGRLGVYELLFMTGQIQKLTLERRSSNEIKNAALSEGMVALRRDGLNKVKQGKTSLEEIIRVVV